MLLLSKKIRFVVMQFEKIEKSKKQEFDYDFL